MNKRVSLWQQQILILYTHINKIKNPTKGNFFGSQENKSARWLLFPRSLKSPLGGRVSVIGFLTRCLCVCLFVCLFGLSSLHGVHVSVCVFVCCIHVCTQCICVLHPTLLCFEIWTFDVNDQMLFRG